MNPKPCEWVRSDIRGELLSDATRAVSESAAFFQRLASFHFSDVDHRQTSTRLRVWFDTYATRDNRLCQDFFI